MNWAVKYLCCDVFRLVPLTCSTEPKGNSSKVVFLSSDMLIKALRQLFFYLNSFWTPLNSS